MNLLALQREFERWLTRETVEMPGAFGERAGAGLAVYLNNYRSQLVACLTASFPAVRAVLEGPAFDAAAATHIERVPPHDWTLDNYALDFPATLAALHPDRPEIEDLARLELALAVAFTGPDGEAVAMAGLGQVDWESAVLEFVPTWTLLPVTTNAHALWTAIRSGQAPPPPEVLARPASIAIWRRHFAPKCRPIEADEAEVFELIRRGRKFGAICAMLVARLGEGPGTAAAAVMLGQWLADGMVEAVRSPP